MQGLSNQEAANRRAAGQGNDLPIQSSRTYWDILRDNLFTFINGVYFFLSLVLIALGRASDVLVLAFVVLLNVVINVIQEIRAKQKLDKIALITRPKASVIREEQEREIDPAEIVVGDVLVVRPGDQIVVDGSIVGEGEIKVDESLLTGESDLIPKQAGDRVYSGSFCVSGKGCYEAEKVGAESLARAKPDKSKKVHGDAFLHFVLPATLTLSLASVLVYLFFLAENIAPVLQWLNGQIPFAEVGNRITLADISRAQRVAETALITMQVFAGLLLLPFLKPPIPAFVGGEPLSRDWRYTILAGLVLLSYLLIIAVPFLRSFFELYPLDFIHYSGIGLVALIWAYAVRLTWRNAFLDRFLGIKISPS
jgi:magnesium-transporting ATPase (P-type)